MNLDGLSLTKFRKTLGITRFFRILSNYYKKGNDEIFKTDDVYAHLILHHNFKKSLNINDIEISNKDVICEDFYNAIINNDFSNISLREVDFNIFKKYVLSEKPFFTDFKEYIWIMANIRDFSVDSARDVWSLQKSKEAIIVGIFKCNKSRGKNRNLIRITPNLSKEVYYPFIDDYISGFNFPVMVQKCPEKITKKVIKNKNNDVSLVLLNEEEKIIDLLRINNTWIYDYALGARKDFFHRYNNCDKYLICDTLDQVLDAIKILEIDNEKGALIRSIIEPCVNEKCNWYRWSNKSLITFRIHKRQSNAPKVLITHDNIAIFEYNIDIQEIEWDYIDISLDGTRYHQGRKNNWFMDKADFDIFSKILEVKK